MTAPTRRAIKTARLMLAAIGDLRNGASKDAITQHIGASVTNKDISKYLNKAINRGIAFGAIKKLRGRYHLGDVMQGIREHRRRRRRSKGRRKGGRRRRRRR